MDPEADVWHSSDRLVYLDVVLLRCSHQCLDAVALSSKAKRSGRFDPCGDKAGN